MPPINCSKCEEQATRSITVRESPVRDPKDPKAKNRSAVRVIRLCETHWAEVESLLP